MDDLFYPHEALARRAQQNRNQLRPWRWRNTETSPNFSSLATRGWYIPLMVIRNPDVRKPTTTTFWMFLKPVVNNGINFQPQLGEFPGFLVAINSMWWLMTDGTLIGVALGRRWVGRFPMSGEWKSNGGNDNCGKFEGFFFLRIPDSKDMEVLVSDYCWEGGQARFHY